MKAPRLFETIYQRSRPQLRLFELDALGEAGWLKSLRLKDYAPRSVHDSSNALQGSLFSSAVG